MEKGRPLVVPNLDRFRDAQNKPHAGFAQALAELSAGRKTRHWIWYVFPQLAGLGQSPTAVYYGLAGVAETEAYLRDRVLRERLLAAAAAVRTHLASAARQPVPLEELMGSEIDALKLISSMTLFRHVARALSSADPLPEFAAMADHADAILAAAMAQGYSPCAYTEDWLRGSRP